MPISKCEDNDCEQLACDDELELNGGLCNRCHFGECADCWDVLTDGHVVLGEGRYAERYCKDCALLEVDYQPLPHGPTDDGGLPAIMEVR